MNEKPENMSKDIIEEKNNTILKLTLILDKLFLVLDDFRQNLNDFQNSCKCIENFRNKLNFNELEDNYKTIVGEYNEHKNKIEEELDLNCDVFKTAADRQTSDPIDGEDIHCYYEDCVYTTIRKSNLLDHIRRTHLNKCILKCIKCEFRCWGPLRLNKHMMANHSDPKDVMTCPFDYCQRICSNKRNMSKHIACVHRDKDLLYCDVCPFRCWGDHKLRSHEKNGHKSEATNISRIGSISHFSKNKVRKYFSSFRCSKCRQSYRTERQLKNHFDWFHHLGCRIIKDRNIFRCFHRNCGFFDNSWSVVLDHVKHDHKKTKNIKRLPTIEERRLKSCHFCELSFDSSLQLKEHLNRSHPKFFCMNIVDSIRTNSSVKNNKSHSSINNNNNIQSNDVIESMETEDKTVEPKPSNDESTVQKSADNFIFGSNLFKQLKHQKEDKQQNPEHSGGVTKDCRQYPPLKPRNKLKQNNKNEKSMISNGMQSKRSASKMFLCEYCEFQTPHTKALREHMSIIHSRIKCDTCDQTFRSDIKLEEHQKNDQCFTLNYYVCGQNSCYFECYDIQTLEDHQRSHTTAPEALLIESYNKEMSENLADLSKEDQFLDIIRINESTDQQLIESNSEQNEVCPLVNTEIKLKEPVRHLIDNLSDTSPQENDYPLKLSHNRSYGLHLKNHLCSDPSELDDSTPVPHKSPEQILTSARAVQRVTDSSSKSCLSFEPSQQNIRVKSEPQESMELSSIEESNNLDEDMEQSLKGLVQNRGQHVIKNQKNNNSSESTKECPKSDSSDNSNKNCVKTEEYEPLVSAQNIIDKNNKSDDNQITISSDDDSIVEVIEGQLLTDEHKNDLEALLMIGNPSGGYSDQHLRPKPTLHFRDMTRSQRKVQQKRHYCLKCGYNRKKILSLHNHMKKVHNLFVCSECETTWISSGALTNHRLSAHISTNNLFKCEANECRFECNDNQEFNEHKRQHLTQNIDKIITDFQTDIERVEIKSEFEEQNNNFVNAEEFLERNNAEIKNIGGVPSPQNKQPIDVCPQSAANEHPSTSGTVKRVRGLNSAREPIKLSAKPTKKICELFKH